MNTKLIIGIVLFVVVLGGGYLLVSTSKPAMAPTPTPSPTSQEAMQPTSVPASPSAMQTKNAVTLTSSGYSPATLTIKAGESVTWTNKSGEDATVNSDPHPTHTAYPPLNLGSFVDGQSLSLSFPKTGTYGYHDHLNPSLRGIIIVQ